MSSVLNVPEQALDAEGDGLQTLRGTQLLYLLIFSTYFRLGPVCFLLVDSEVLPDEDLMPIWLIYCLFARIIY